MRFSFLSLLAAAFCLTGCNSSLLHNLKPHRLHRLNQGPAPSSHANFSIPAEEISAQELTRESERVPDDLPIDD